MSGKNNEAKVEVEVSDTIMDELRRKYPRKARLMDYGKSRRMRCWFTCMECMGGSWVEVKTCTNHECPSYQEIKGREPIPAGTFPSEEEYAEMEARAVSDKQLDAHKAAGDRFRKLHGQAQEKP